MYRKYGSSTQAVKDGLKENLLLAQCGMSHVNVACCLIANNGKSSNKFFASNIEIARSVVYHAEEVALIKAISKGYTKPIHVYITSTSDKHLVPMCLKCRYIYSYINMDCNVTVLDKNLQPKLTTSIKDSVNYPYYGQGFIV